MKQNKSPLTSYKMPLRTRAKIRYGMLCISVRRLYNQYRMVTMAVPAVALASIMLVYVSVGSVTIPKETHVAVVDSTPTLTNSAEEDVVAAASPVVVNNSPIVADTSAVNNQASYTRHKKIVAYMAARDITTKVSKIETQNMQQRLLRQKISNQSHVSLAPKSTIVRRQISFS